jgi:hypothetical protein
MRRKQLQALISGKLGVGRSECVLSVLQATASMRVRDRLNSIFIDFS